MSEIFQKIYDCLNGEFPTTTTSKYKAIIDTYDITNFDTDIPINIRPLECPFELDTFQKRAVYRIGNFENVFIAAHTSSGKTLAAEWAIAQSLLQSRNAIYTSPIKALSNQKYRDFKDKFNHDKYFSSSLDATENVGIITGDVQVNNSAKCLVMTTEILRNMIYKCDPYLNDVDWIIFDEIHYMNDNERGRIWEEIIQMAPCHISMIFLSATTPNAVQFSNWVADIRKRNVYICQTLTRPIPIEHYITIGTTQQSLSQYYEEIVEKTTVGNEKQKNKKVKTMNEDGEIVNKSPQKIVKLNKRFELKDEIRRKHIPNDNAFKMSVSQFYQLTNSNQMRNILLDEIKKFITEGETIEECKTGAMWMLTALVEVSTEACNAMPWLLQ